MNKAAHAQHGYIKTTLVILCLVAGVALYVFFKPQASQEALVLVPVEFKGLPDDVIISSSSTHTVEIRVRGKKERLENLKSPVCRLSLAQAQVGEKYIPVRPQSIILPQNVHILSVEPVSVRVTLVRKISRTVPVDIVYVGLPAKGYRLERAEANPGTITIAGPQNLIETIERIRTKAVDISGLSESCKKEAVYDIDPSWAVVLPDGPVVANLTFSEKSVVKKIDIPLTLPDKVTHINPASASLEISGPENRFTGLNILKDIEVSISVKDLKPGVYVRRATISLPVDFTLISVKPELFTLTVK